MSNSMDAVVERETREVDHRPGRHIANEELDMPSHASIGSAGRSVPRMATFLFADLSAFSELAASLRDETVEFVVDLLRATVTQTIEEHGGVVNQFLGDEVYAIFGLPEARDDDPLRAVAAAVAMHRATRALSSRLEQAVRQPLRLHTGINTGLARIKRGGPFDGPYRVTGSSLNLAARLRSLAGPDEILVGPDTHDALNGRFDMREHAARYFKRSDSTSSAYAMTG